MNDIREEFIIIGKVASPWGLDGHLKIDVETDFPQRFDAGSMVYINREPRIIDSVIWHKGKAVIKLGGLDTEEDADKLSGTFVEIHRDQLFELREGEYYHFQLIGMTVRTTSGEMIGELTGILRMSGADIYVVKNENDEILLPATDDVVKSVDIGNGILTIEPVEGLLELNKKKKR